MSLLPLRFVCFFLVFPPLERSCFTKRLVNISARTRRKQGRGGWRKRNTTRENNLLYLLHLPESGKGRRIMRNAASRERRHFLVLCLFLWESLAVEDKGVWGEGTGSGEKEEKPGAKMVFNSIYMLRRRWWKGLRMSCKKWEVKRQWLKRKGHTNNV